jgi:tryptophan-rich sensory protein
MFPPGTKHVVLIYVLTAVVVAFLPLLLSPRSLIAMIFSLILGWVAAIGAVILAHRLSQR